MDKLLEKLYNGQLYPCEEIFTRIDSESGDIYSRIEEISEKLKKYAMKNY